jgi:serine/threonine-protein kinase
MHLIHRDIKPPNLLLTAAGETKVLDFGIARADFGGREAQTKSVLYGSVGYMAPERMEFEELPAGDVYALGTVLFELLDGQPLGKGSTVRL